MTVRKGPTRPATHWNFSWAETGIYGFSIENVKIDNEMAQQHMPTHPENRLKSLRYELLACEITQSGNKIAKQIHRRSHSIQEQAQFEWHRRGENLCVNLRWRKADKEPALNKTQASRMARLNSLKSQQSQVCSRWIELDCFFSVSTSHIQYSFITRSKGGHRASELCVIVVRQRCPDSAGQRKCCITTRMYVFRQDEIELPSFVGSLRVFFLVEFQHMSAAFLFTVSLSNGSYYVAIVW